MSDLLNEASLVLIPSGIKASKVYAQIPEDGSGDMTFSRASDATRVNSLGLVEKVRTNVVTYSQDFSGADWTVSNNTITTNTTTAPDGTTTADKTASNQTFTGVSLVSQSLSVSSPTVSIYAKADSLTQMLFYCGGANNGIYFNLSNGTFLDYYTTPTNITGYSISNVGNGWYRYSITYNATIDSLRVYLAKSQSINQSYTSGEGFFVWGAQVEVSDFGPTAYIPTTSSAVSVGPYSNIPRLNYQNGGGGCPSLLLEAQRTNLFYPSEDFTNANWVASNLTITANDTISPDGYQNADKFVTTSTTFENQVRFGTFSITGSAGSAYTVSVFAKKGTADFLRIRNLFVQDGATSGNAWFNLSTGAVGTVQSSQTASIQNMGNGWYRCILTGVVGSTNNYNFVDIGFTNTDASNYPSTSVNGYVWGAQLEAGSYVSSYIPTLGTSVTRMADYAYKTSASGLIGQTEGVVFVDFNLPSIETDVNYPFIIDLYNDNSNRFGFARYPNGGIHIYMIASGSSQFTYNTTQLTGDFKLALGYKNNDCVVYLNGSLLHTVTSASIPTTNVIALNAINEFGSYNTQQLIKQVVLFPTRLTNAQLADITS